MRRPDSDDGRSAARPLHERGYDKRRPLACGMVIDTDDRIAARRNEDAQSHQPAYYPIGGLRLCHCVARS
jgi:hypothetical protein